MIRVSLSTTLFFLCCMALASCSNPSNHGEAKKPLVSPYPIKPLQIDDGKEEGWGADLRLSIVEESETDSTRSYRAISSHEGRDLGLLVVVPKPKKEGAGFGAGMMLKSIGTPSNNLLQLLARLYKQGGTNLQFRESISVNYANLQEMAKAMGGEGSYTVASEYKLFFESTDGESYAELYLNINPEEHWLEWKEKDEEYRPAILQFLKK